MRSTGRGATQQSSAPFNRRVVLDFIRQQGAASRKDIADMVSLSPQTVANITNDLEAIGLIVSRRQKVDKARGQPPIAFELNPQAGNAIGISLEPGRASAALVNLVGEIRSRCEVEMDTSDRRQMLAAMLQLVAQLRRESTERLWGIGVALPGPLGHTELSFVGPTALEGWSDLSVLDELGQVTGLPLFYRIDSVAGALGETLFGVARNLDDFFYLHLGLGLGGALVIGRSAYPGADGNATEIGHVPIVPGGTPCYCGNRGCLERYVSMHSLAEALGVSDHDVWAVDLAQRLQQPEDEALQRWCRQAADRLRDAVCMIENMLDPRSIVIGGSAPKVLVERLVALAQPWHRSVRGGIGSPETRIVLSDRQDDSSLLGAAVLPIYEMLSPRLEVLQQDRRNEVDVAALMGHRKAAARWGQ
ncbi:MAG: ROK family transcriptional regulator [Proteobacteria bacterium]|jgi:predicted NBD/HSP70 family sugar kinase|nr:ROK family transcriptional regulator [Methylibium sp.]MCH8856340.1 ROK family transcriptional regulator [Pseudomonadota bacterium]|mmetsp:Transcript_6619/g.27532  ORF Transcript_6619/g.27532 Transcript_6619/m.27532 type:complete len:418 (+) Transcript_6619:3011-4264(+)